MFCALLTSRYQVSVYRTNGPLVHNAGINLKSRYNCGSKYFAFLSFFHEILFFFTELDQC